MAQQLIGLGDAANDGTGDSLRVAGQKTNENFSELYERPVGIEDAPADGKLYGRQDAAWAEIIAGEGGGTGGGGSAGSTDGWADLSFGAVETLYGRNVYRSVESFNLAIGQRLELRAYVQRTTALSVGLGYGTPTAAALISAQNDGNVVLYQNNGSADTARKAAGSGANRANEGHCRLNFVAIPQSAGAIHMTGRADFVGVQPVDSTIGVNGSVRAFVTTADITKTRVQYRIVNAAEAYGSNGGSSGNAVVANIAAEQSDLQASQRGQYLRFTAATAKTLNVRAEATAALPANGEWNIRNAGAGALTLVAAAGVTLFAPSGGTLVVPSGGTITLKRVAANQFDVLGQTVPA